jgi:hypothetical protein
VTVNSDVKRDAQMDWSSIAHQDGQRVALFTTSEAQASTQTDHLRIVFNFFDELWRIALVTK